MEVVVLSVPLTAIFHGPTRTTTVHSWPRVKVRPPASSLPIHLFQSASPPIILSRATSKNSSAEVEESDDEIMGKEEEEEGEGYFEDGIELEEEDDVGETYVGDGGEGGGISLCGLSWDNVAVSIAEEVSMSSFDGDLKIFALKTSANQLIQLRIEKLSTKYGSPTLTDIIDFTNAYRARLDEAVTKGAIPHNYSLQVSSPGAERAVRIPEDLERFKDRTMFVKYHTSSESEQSQMEQGIFKLISFDMDSGSCIWGIADVRVNREQGEKSKGRPLNKKQKEWRLQMSFKSLQLVRLY